MASESGVPDKSSSAPSPPPPAPTAQQTVEKKLEHAEVAEPEKTGSAPEEEVEEVKMPIVEESSTPQDKPEDKRIDPAAAPQEEEELDATASEVLPPKEEGEQAEPDPDESVAQASTKKVEEKLEQPSLGQPEEQVKVEIVEEKAKKAKKETDEPQPSGEVVEKQGKISGDSVEKEPEPEVVDGKDDSKEVPIKDDEIQKEESAKLMASKASEAGEEPEKTTKTNPAEPIAVDETKPLIEVDKAEELKEAVEEAPAKAVEEEVVEKTEGAQADAIEGQAEKGVMEKVEAPHAEYTEVQGQQEPKGQSEVAEMVEKTSEEIKSRESLGDLMKKQEENQDQPVEEKVTERNEKVALIEKETQVDKKEDVEQSSVPEAVETAVVEDKEKELSEPKEVEEPAKQLAPEVKDAEAKVEENKLEKGVVTHGSTQQTEEVHSESAPIPAKDVTEKSLEVESVSRKVELPPESKEQEAKRETEEVAVPIAIKKNGEGEEKPGDVTATEESKGPETKEDKTPDETVQKGGVEAAGKPEEQNISDADKTKDSKQEQPKEEAPAKPVKQSNNLISKVKHSLAKAKKAIIGKSPSSKSISTETKG